MFENILFRAKKADKYGGEWITSSAIQVRKNGVLLGELDKVVRDNGMSDLDVLSENTRWYPVKPETLCQALTYCTFDVNDGNERCPIFDKDIVELTLPSGTKFRYAIWYMEEGSSFIAVPWSEEAVNSDAALFVNYPVNFKEAIDWKDFAFMMQDPYGDLKSIKVIGNYIDNPELFYPVRKGGKK